MRLGIHYIGGNMSQHWDWLEGLRPDANKVLDFDDPVVLSRLAACSKYLIYRQYVNDGEDKPQEYLYTRISPSDYLARHPVDKLRQVPGIMIETPNEQQVWNGDQAQQFAAWQLEFIRLAHLEGLRVCALNFSTGHPAIALAPYFREVAEKADAVGKHCYWLPAIGFDDIYHAVDFMKALNTDKPIIATETGIDKDGTPETSGWIAQLGNTEQGRNQYAWVLAQIQMELAWGGFDGATIFTDGGNWPSFQLAPMYSLLEQLPDVETIKPQRGPFSTPFRVTQRFGENPAIYSPFGFAGHDGTDGTPTPKDADPTVHALESGIVIVDVNVPTGNYGNYVCIWNQETRHRVYYCHLASNSVSLNQRVTAGQAIGVMGNTGNSTAPHLHIGVRETDDKGNTLNWGNGYKGYVDPAKIFPQLAG